MQCRVNGSVVVLLGSLICGLTTVWVYDLVVSSENNLPDKAKESWSIDARKSLEIIVLRRT